MPRIRNRRRFYRTITVTTLVLLCVATMALGDDSPGPDVGEVVPEFRLPDQYGELRALSDLVGENGLILLFFRTADW